MNLETWLSEAIGPFPPGVRARLTREYSAHFEESGGEDAEALFGSPQSVCKALARLYLKEDRLNKLKTVNFSSYVPLVIIYFLVLSDAPDWASSLLTPTLVSIVLVWFLTKSLHQARRHSAKILLSSALSVITGGLLPFYTPHTTDIALFVLPVLASLVCVVSIADYVISDARLRRTLALEQVSARPQS